MVSADRFTWKDINVEGLLRQILFLQIGSLGMTDLFGSTSLGITELLEKN